MLRSRRERLDRARELLARRGGAAVFLGRYSSVVWDQRSASMAPLAVERAALWGAAPGAVTSK
jgi:hypothetical protein